MTARTLFDTQTTTEATAAAPTIERRLDRRTITATWTVGDPYPAHGGEETHQRQVVLHCDHDSHRKGFTALLRAETAIYRGGRHYATAFALFADPMVRLAGEPIVRYSAKRLQEFFARSLAHVTEARERGDYGELFEPATGQA